MAEVAGLNEGVPVLLCSDFAVGALELARDGTDALGRRKVLTLTVTSRTLAVLHSEFSLTNGVWFYGTVFE